MGTQTDIKRGEIEKMEQSIFKYQEQITQEQNKVQQKETELASLEKEIKELTDKQKKDERTIQELQSKLPNEVEKKLASYFNLSVPELLKKDDELLMALITQLKRDQITQQELQEELTKLQTTKTEEENKAAKLEKEIIVEKLLPEAFANWLEYMRKEEKRVGILFPAMVKFAFSPHMSEYVDYG
ncbi:5287_t:CDS:2, partial [Racocetra persica]